MEPGDALPELRITPDRYATVRYAGASGDYDPVHVDEEFARAVGLPGRVLHALYGMALVARTVTEAGGGPAALKRLSVQFRGIGLPEREVVVAARVASVADGIATIHAEAVQDGRTIIGDAKAELEL